MSFSMTAALPSFSMTGILNFLNLLSDQTLSLSVGQGGYLSRLLRQYVLNKSVLWRFLKANAMCLRWKVFISRITSPTE